MTKEFFIRRDRHDPEAFELIRVHNTYSRSICPVTHAELCELGVLLAEFTSATRFCASVEQTSGGSTSPDFTTAREAWAWLLAVRTCQEETRSDEHSSTWERLRRLACGENVFGAVHEDVPVHITGTGSFTAFLDDTIFCYKVTARQSR